MALDANLNNVPLTGNFTTKADGSVFLNKLIANPALQLSGVSNVDDAGNLNVSGNATIKENLNVSGSANIRGDLIGNNIISALSGLSLSGNLSAVDDEGKAFVFRRDDDASYENLIKAHDGTITLQAEDDVHLKSNTGEDFARFNENAAVWLYYNNVRKIETGIDGAYVSGVAKNTEGTSTSSTHSVANENSSALDMADFKQPHGGAFWWAQTPTVGTETTAEVNFAAGTVPSGVSSVGRVGASNTNGYYLWDYPTNKLDVSADGIYRVTLNAAVIVGDNTNTEWKLYINGISIYSQTLRVHTVTDPHLVWIDWVGPVLAGFGAIYVTGRGVAGGGPALSISKGSTLFVQRLA